jgi:hypothetical protein
MVLAFSGASSCIGMSLYLELSAIFVDKFGENMVFGTIIFLNIIVLVPLLIAIAFGKYGNEKLADEN